MPPSSRAVASNVAGNLWQIKIEVGDTVKQGDVVMIIESMKMEINVTAPIDGEITHIFCQEGIQIGAGQDLCVINMKD